MTIKEIKEELKASNNPVAKPFHHGTIPIRIAHSVEAIEDSLCILSQGE